MNGMAGSSGRQTFSKEQLVQDLKRMGICQGDSVAVTLSFKSVGLVEGGPEGFLDALLQTVGPQGTIMMNTFTLDFPISEISSKFIFDPSSTVPYTGVVPITLLNRKGALRSRHPVCSVVSFGRFAKFLTEEHNEKSKPYLPYAKLAQIEGKYLCIGIGNELVAIRHEAQYQAMVPTFLRCGVQYKSEIGETSLFVWEHPPCEKNLSYLVPKIENLGLIQHGTVGQASALVASAADLIRSMSWMLRKDLTLNQCGDILCLQCRELERRLKLWKNIANPAFFQRSSIMRRALGFRNSFLLLKKHSRLLIRDSSHETSLHKAMEICFRYFARFLVRVLK